MSQPVLVLETYSRCMYRAAAGDRARLAGNAVVPYTFPIELLCDLDPASHTSGRGSLQGLFVTTVQYCDAGNTLY